MSIIILYLIYIYENISSWLADDLVWNIIRSIGTIVPLYFIYLNIRNTRYMKAYEFLGKEDDKFDSAEMIENRCQLAKCFLQDPTNYKKMDDYASFVLDYFESLGLLLRKGIVPIYFMWDFNAAIMLPYRKNLLNFINRERREDGDDTIHEESEYLFSRILKYDKKKNKKDHENYSENEIRDFLKSELNIKIREGMYSDLEKVSIIERICFQNSARTKKDIEEIYCDGKHDNFFVAEVGGKGIVGFICGLIENEIGVIATDHTFYTAYPTYLQPKLI